MSTPSGTAFPAVIPAHIASRGLAEAMVAALRTSDAVVVDHAVPAARVAALRAEAVAAEAAGRFAVGRIGRAHAAAGVLRGDRICWLDDLGASPECARMQAELERWRVVLDRGLLLGARTLEAQLACYPAGAVYARHRDRFTGGVPAQGERLLSLVLYLNAGWSAAEGGALRLYDAADRPHDLLPLGGRLVAFLSDRVEHEVLPATRARWSLAAWLRRA